MHLYSYELMNPIIDVHDTKLILNKDFSFNFRLCLAGISLKEVSEGS